MAQPEHYVQTDCSSPDHPKIHALATLLGCHEVAALGAITALRCRVMRHCPDGDVSAISERTLKVWLLGFPRVSWSAFVDSRLVDQAGDARTMHGWERYDRKEEMRRNNAERQQRHRDKRVTSRVTSRESNGAEGEGEGEGEREGKNYNIPVGLTPTGPDKVDELFEKWNALAKANGLPTAAQITPARKAKAKARIAEGLLERWSEFATALPRVMDGHYVGQNDRGWRANPEWLLRPDVWLGVIESAAPKGNQSSAGPAPESADARRSRRLDALTAAVFARVDFGATGKIPRLFGDALLDLRCDERTIGIRRDPTGKLRDVRIEFVEVRLLDAMDADGVPDNGIAAWAAREVQIIHTPAAAQDRSGAA